jgi:hypothetical protein
MKSVQECQVPRGAIKCRKCIKERQGCHWGREKPVSVGVKGVKRKVVIDVESEDEDEEEEDAPPP